MTFYGNKLTYECGLARRFENPETGFLYDERSIVCNWNKTWSPYNELDSCKWVACINPPQPPSYTNLQVDWDGVPVNFSSSIPYTCNSDDVTRYFELDRDMETYNITCLGKDKEYVAISTVSLQMMGAGRLHKCGRNVLQASTVHLLLQ